MLNMNYQFCYNFTEIMSTLQEEAQRLVLQKAEKKTEVRISINDYIVEDFKV